MSFSMSSINYVVGRVYPFDSHFDVLTLSIMNQQAQGCVKGYWGEEAEEEEEEEGGKKKEKKERHHFPDPSTAHSLV